MSDAALVRRAPDAAGVALGNVQWGLDIIMSSPVRECASMNFWYNFTTTGVELPPEIHLPESGAISFHTPDTAKDQWMVFSPPMGTGVLSWSCPLAAGQTFLLRGVADYEEIVTVEKNGNGCTQQGPPATTTFDHGTLALPIFTSFLAAQYPITSLSTTSAFRSTAFPTGSFPTETVPLGLAVGATNTPSSQSTTTPTSSNGPPIAAIAGGVAGAVLAILLVVLLFVCWRRRRRRDQKAQPSMTTARPLTPTQAPSTTANSGAAVAGSPHILPAPGFGGKRRHIEQQPSATTLRSSPTAPQGTTEGFFRDDSFPPTTMDGASSYHGVHRGLGDDPAAPPEYSRLVST
ncbi:hypothetical protein BKA62DRAFT_691882 [Auriculariales sp. MPI-PUGE-AT-0066]|nr:hypothetical protein BKA62DRAFT_691882 [Auriculariales sp. MPI-PUGE-AT-0066]